MPINLNKILALQNVTKIFENKKTIKFKDEAFVSSPPFIVVPIQETIHFKSLCKRNFSDYMGYIKESGQKDRSSEKFLELESTINNLNEIKIRLIYSSEIDRFLIIDGLHRICVCIKKGLIKESIKEENINLYFDKNTITKIEKEVKKTIGGTIETKNWYNRTKNGYHSFNIGNINIIGQRNPKIRLKEIKKVYNFEGKKIIDLGCNNGGMLFHLTEIKKGLGLDIDQRCIDCANELKKIFQFEYELDFLKADLNEPLKLKEKFDVAFLFSLGSWIKNWRGLYKDTSSIAETIFLETNNDDEGKEQLNYMLNLGYNIRLVCNESIDDFTKNTKRKTYILKK